MLKSKHKRLPGSVCMLHVTDLDWMLSGHRILQPRRYEWHAEVTSGYKKDNNDNKELIQSDSTSHKMDLKTDVAAKYVKAKVRLLTILQSSCTSVPYLVSESSIFATNQTPT